LICIYRSTDRLARISVDITNTSDIDWKIDIRKSIARPPLSIRPLLIKIAEDTRAKARRVFAHRGLYNKSTPKEEIHNAWRSEVFKGGSCPSKTLVHENHLGTIAR
jgi:hypothetical protein